MGFFSSIKSGFNAIGKGLGKAFGVVTAPIKEVWGVVKDTVHTVAHTPERVLKSFDKATGVIGGLGNNIQANVGSAAGAVTSVADGAAHISDNARYISGDAKDVTQSPIVWAALGLGALMVLRT